MVWLRGWSPASGSLFYKKRASKHGLFNSRTSPFRSMDHGPVQPKNDQEWLDYQHEIGLRHHSIKKNKPDTVDAVPIIHFRYLVAFIFPITATIKSFLANKGNGADEVEKMYAAWFKAVTLTVTLWCHPYITKGEF